MAAIGDTVGETIQNWTELDTRQNYAVNPYYRLSIFVGVQIMRPNYVHCETPLVLDIH